MARYFKLTTLSPEFWTENFDTRVEHNKTFIEVQGALTFIGQNNRRKKEGWRPVDTFFMKQGIDINDHFLKAKNCQRQYSVSRVIFSIGIWGTLSSGQ